MVQNSLIWILLGPFPLILSVHQKKNEKTFRTSSMSGPSYTVNVVNTNLSKPHLPENLQFEQISEFMDNLCTIKPFVYSERRYIPSNKYLR